MTVPIYLYDVADETPTNALHPVAQKAYHSPLQLYPTRRTYNHSKSHSSSGHLALLRSPEADHHPSPASRSKPKPINNAVLNLYEPNPTPQTWNEKTPMHLYDINFAFPFHFLQTEHVRLEPLVPSKHLQGFLSLPDESWAASGNLGPYDRESALRDIEEFRADPSSLLMAVIDLQAERAGKDPFAGVYGLIRVTEEYMDAIFGVINIHPRYRRTHINTHAMKLTLSYLFDELKLVRVQYDADVTNEASIRAAERFGFKAEGICRNYNGLARPRSTDTLPVEPGIQGDNEKGQAGQARSHDTWLSAMTDYDWVNGGKEGLEKLMERPVVDTTLL
ncbi:hypothetical protein IAU59_000923 [Kwoniella sp. CBS 9459]